MLISAITNNIGITNNSAFRVMNDNSAMMGLVSRAGNASNLSDVFQSEKSLMADKINSQLMYRMSEAQLESLKKLEKEHIKRTFSTFA